MQVEINTYAHSPFSVRRQHKTVLTRRGSRYIRIGCSCGFMHHDEGVVQAHVDFEHNEPRIVCLIVDRDRWSLEGDVVWRSERNALRASGL